MAEKPTSPAPINRWANKGNLTTGDLTGHLVRMTVPMIWGIFAMISFQLVDLFFIAMLGTKPLAALSFTMPITMIVFSLVIGLVIAMSSVLSREIGKKRQSRVNRITTHGLIFAGLFGIAVALIGLIFMDPIFQTMGASEEMLPLIRQYMVIWFGGSIFLTLPMVGNAAMRAQGDTISPAIIMSVVALVNVILDPILIFGLLGFPRLELQGAAIATVFANLCAMIAGLYILGAKKKMLAVRPLRLFLFGDSIKRLIFIALPAGITSTIQPFTNAVIISFLATYSAESVAAFGIVTRIEAFVFIILMALAGGMAPIIGQNWGAGNYERVNETLRKVFKFSIFWALAVAIILAIFARPIAGLFTNEPEIIRLAALYFWIVPISYAAGNLIQAWGSAFNAMGQPIRSVIMIFGKYLLIQIPAAYIGSRIYGVPGIFIAIALTNLFVGIFLHIWNWKSCKKIEAKITASI